MCPPALYCCVRLCLAILYICLPALDVASSSFDFEKHKLFGVYGGIISAFLAEGQETVGEPHSSHGAPKRGGGEPGDRGAGIKGKEIVESGRRAVDLGLASWVLKDEAACEGQKGCMGEKGKPPEHEGTTDGKTREREKEREREREKEREGEREREREREQEKKQHIATHKTN